MGLTTVCFGDVSFPGWGGLLDKAFVIAYVIAYDQASEKITHRILAWSQIHHCNTQLLEWNPIGVR